MAIFSLTLRRRAAAAEIRGNFGVSADSAVTVADKTGYPQTIFIEARMELLSRSTNPTSLDNIWNAGKRIRRRAMELAKLAAWRNNG
jgi:hypothetical protein